MGEVLKQGEEGSVEALHTPAFCFREEGVSIRFLVQSSDQDRQFGFSSKHCVRLFFWAGKDPKVGKVVRDFNLERIHEENSAILPEVLEHIKEYKERESLDERQAQLIDSAIGVFEQITTPKEEY